jgi:hypothetical protein
VLSLSHLQQLLSLDGWNLVWVLEVALVAAVAAWLQVLVVVVKVPPPLVDTVKKLTAL